jgi:sugar phosphate isomerase/epimerase
VFFGKCALSSDSELDAVADRLKELAPLAEKAGIVLGFENTVSAAQNERVLDRVGSQALKVYYDIGNATNLSGFDAPAEIRRLGAARICQFHIKDKGYLGEGKVDVEASMRAMAEIGFRGFGMLETAVLTTPEEDARRNLVYAREAWRKASNA